MIDSAVVATAELEALVSALSRVGSVQHGSDPSDQVRVDQLAVLERLKGAVSAAQARVTAAFVDSQQDVAQAWRQRARECSDVGDFEGVAGSAGAGSSGLVQRPAPGGRHPRSNIAVASVGHERRGGAGRVGAARVAGAGRGPCPARGGAHPGAAAHVGGADRRRGQ